MRGCYHFRMVGQAEIIVGTEIDDRMRLAVIVEGSARFRRTEKLRLVQFDGPLPDMVPASEGRGWLQRVLAVADKEIAQAELAGIRFHAQTGALFQRRSS